MFLQGATETSFQCNLLTSQIAIYYDPLECQLMVTVIEAVDLAPRNEGSGRNPYIKMFLLPDRR